MKLYALPRHITIKFLERKKTNLELNGTELLLKKVRDESLFLFDLGKRGPPSQRRNVSLPKLDIVVYATDGDAGFDRGLHVNA